MQQTKRTLRRALPMLLLLAGVLLLSACGEQPMVLDPKGPIASDQKDLILISSLLCAVILFPVLGLTAYIVWKYREREGSTAAYEPHFSHSTKLELIWWGIPILIIIILAAVTARYTYALEPTKPIESEKKAITIQATSLDWKWLFTYPEQGIATVNYLQIPEDVPVKFELTSDAPMNSFWIPQLGGQMYTMSGMGMTLFLQADHEGRYYGSGANFSGEYFGDMKFFVDVKPQSQFDAWVQEVKASPEKLTNDSYEKLAEKGTSPVVLYSSFPEGLFQRIVTKYAPGGHAHGQHNEPTPQSKTDPVQQPLPDAKEDHTQGGSTGTDHSGHTGH
ncbi:cytochrome aa3 quinol oxidase subunit II [Paenibacillus mucilaginosus]|uniref:Quinol oxidase subunit 2 n=2 Tax=Paenibacillus mucilaginosus TaxID=61624 RepID=H6NNN8_9BACL|nr:cytochrome aa3 quinol oxidase subunit II [Paenibacillus mucilaginosus]AEI45691.1 quinol oxidase polypeptide II precursor [Paenibacillus mucilaginosus KNP414]AFC33359.1 quinol oxidase polypeptide II [Paenibacillus mucilaginosus 3016]MCG7215118.1 cytochrome aa3 quinol oxidase subunit II [Paenibacillus mucilaginosus]WDM27083.1 cytochrome aa3 quinol oxidase subunit II [Paenibacillus mucilaginosus]WFA21775.1 cytochrome aa3 quinol oxidase subunit II [Paenibacillus mucilaginosus]